MSTLDEYCQSESEALKRTHRSRTLKSSTRKDVHVVQDGKKYLSFSCNDYLGLSQHPAVIKASNEALQSYGSGAGASRLVTGNHPLYTPLEAKIAHMKHTQAALVFGSGYLTNMGVIPALVGKGDIIFADKLVHACLLDGAQLSGAKLVRFKHNDMSHLEALMAEHRSRYRQALIVVDHVYSMDGDVAPLKDISEIACKNNAWLMADDAHGFGIVKPEKDVQIDIWMGTLSKAVGGYGGYIAASQQVVDYLVSSARSFIFSTGLPPATCAAAFAALECMEQEPERATRAVGHANELCKAVDLPPTVSTIVPIIVADETKALAISEALKQRGILAAAIRPPTVPPGTSRLRLAFSALHTQAQVDQLITALKHQGIGV